MASDEFQDPAGQGGKGIALVVDDDASIRRLLGEVLQRAGYSCVLSSDGAEALSLVELLHPRLVIVDLVMEKVSGVEVALELHMRHPDIVIAGISGWPGFWDATDLSSLGIRRVFGKPFDLNELLSWLASLADR